MVMTTKQTAGYDKLEQLYGLSPRDVKNWVHLSSPRESNLGSTSKYILGQRGIEVSVSDRDGLPHAVSRLYARLPGGEIVGIYLSRPEDADTQLAQWKDGRPQGLFLASLVGKDLIANSLAYANYCEPKRKIKAAIEVASPTRVGRPRIYYTFEDAIRLKGIPYEVVEISLPVDPQIGMPLGSGKVVVAAQKDLGITNLEDFKAFAKKTRPRVGPSWRFDDLAELWLDGVLGDGKYQLMWDKESGTRLPKGLYGSPEGDPYIDVTVEFMQSGTTLAEHGMVPIAELMRSKPVIITRDAGNPLLREFLGELIAE